MIHSQSALRFSCKAFAFMAYLSPLLACKFPESEDMPLLFASVYSAQHKARHKIQHRIEIH